MDVQQPVLFTATLVFKDGKILLGKRGGSTIGGGLYGTPGGKLDHLETFEQCIKREFAEEVGVEIDHLQFVCLVNSRDFAPKHFIGAVFRADWRSGEPENREPEKCMGWEWLDPENIPGGTTAATRCGLEALKTGQCLFD